MKINDTVEYTGKHEKYIGRNAVVTDYSAASSQVQVQFSNGDPLWFMAGCFRVTQKAKVAPPATTTKPALPLDSAERKRWPMFSGLLQYFPAALAHVSNHSFVGNEKHNPGLALQHARGKSGDHEDCIVRHLVDSAEHPAGSAEKIDELRALAWRALALLQEQCELAGHRPAPAASFTKDKNAST
jgi:hypothetical protein